MEGAGRSILAGVILVGLVWSLWGGFGRGGRTSGPEASDAPAGGASKEEWIPLFPDSGPGRWKEVDFLEPGASTWKDGVLAIAPGLELSGVRWEGPLPASPYEIELEARRVAGNDFFCGMTVPVRGPGTCVTFVVGGWGGGVVGISSIDDFDASENETGTYLSLEDRRWYRLRLAVRPNRLEAWIDDEQVVEIDTTNRLLGLRYGDIGMSAPLGLATWQTGAELRRMRWRPIAPAREGAAER